MSVLAAAPRLQDWWRGAIPYYDVGTCSGAFPARSTHVRQSLRVWEHLGEKLLSRFNRVILKLTVLKMTTACEARD
jgi:hypothetical protein